MSSFLDELGTYLDEQNVGVFVDTGRTIFVGVQPASPDECVTLLGLPGYTLDNSRDVPEFVFPRFQALIRSDSYEAGATLLASLRAALHGKTDSALSLTTWRVMRIHVEQEGGPIGHDDAGRYEFSVNFSAQIHERPPEEEE